MFKEKNELNKGKNTKTKVKTNNTSTITKKENKEKIDEFMIVGYKKGKVLVNVNGFTVGLKTDKKINKESGQMVRVSHKGITNKNKLNEYRVIG